MTSEFEQGKYWEGTGNGGFKCDVSGGYHLAAALKIVG
jgi:hypothetical protein